MSDKTRKILSIVLIIICVGAVLWDLSHGGSLYTILFGEPSVPQEPDSGIHEIVDPEPGNDPVPIEDPLPVDDPAPDPDDGAVKLDEHGTYDSKEDVALFIHTYGRLPDNYITKKEAEALGWTGGSVEQVAPGKCIGGTYFGNYEGLLPKKKGRSYYECDIDTLGKKSRGAKRIIFSNDGLIYYTADHYESFELLYGEP